MIASRSPTTSSASTVLVALRWQVPVGYHLLAYGLAALSGSTASSAGCEACGEEGSGRRRETAVKPSSVKQEVSGRFAQ